MKLVHLTVVVLLPAAIACSGDLQRTQDTAQNAQGISCASDADCPSAESCVHGSCAAPPQMTPSGCTSAADCASGEQCSSGVCVANTTIPQACASDTDCASGEICRADGLCVTNPWACASDADCNARGGYVCTNGQCGPTTTSGCNGSNCPCDFLAQDCPFGLRCYPWGPVSTDGQCYGQGGKQVGESCIEPPLEGPDACAGGLVCVYADENDLTGTCLLLCASDSDCASGEECREFTDPSTGVTTQWGLCITPLPPPPPTPPPPCDANAQNCPSGALCTPRDIGPNECVTAGSGSDGDGCANASDCGVGLMCVAFAGSSPANDYWTLLQAYIDRGGGTCKWPCASSSDCGPSQSCEPVITSNTGLPRSFGACD